MMKPTKPRIKPTFYNAKPNRRRSKANFFIRLVCKAMEAFCNLFNII